MAMPSLQSVNQSDIFQVSGANSTITSETAINFGKACMQLLIGVSTSDLLIDLTNTASGTSGANCTLLPAGQRFEMKSLQPLQKIRIKAAGATGSYSITAF